jgi:hypothetical protein
MPPINVGIRGSGYIFKKTSFHSMKILIKLLCVFSAVFLFTACQKEYSLETGNTGGLARGSLQDTLGNCQQVIVRGQYFTDSTLADSNFVLVQVRVTTPGNYRISTDALNGFSFRDSGYLPNTGWQTLKLRAIGRPILAQATDFAVTFDTTVCFFTVPVTQGSGTPGGTQAVYTLTPGTAGACSNSALAGTYQTGTTLSATNRVSLQVNVTTPGAWTVSTNTVNGMRFGGTGTFTATGPQTITLQGTGTPVTAGTSNIPVTAGTSTCSFPVTVTQSTGASTNPNDADSAWQFTEGTKFMHGTFDITDDSTIAGFGYGILMIGSTSATGDSVIIIQLLFAGSSTVQTGTYNTNTIFASLKYQDYKDPANPKDIYVANNTATGTNTAIVVTSWNPTTRVISGTFSGTAKNTAGANVNITGGKFTAKIE